MKHFSYIGSGPYCYSNALAMMLGRGAPDTATIEFATGSPFGMQLLGGALPFFDPYGWTPELGVAAALDALGWVSARVRSDTAEEALDRLRHALVDGPVWVGPVEMGWLRHQPGKSGPIGADHYVVVLSVDEDCVEMHDPQGYPHARLPIGDFLKAWQTASLDYGENFTMRTGFRRLRAVREEDAIRAALPMAKRLLALEETHHLPVGTIGNEMAAEVFARQLEAGCSDDLRDHLVHFAIRVGARRLADAATCFARIGQEQACAIATEQARLVGALQYPLVLGDDAGAAAILRRLAPTYRRLLHALGD